MQKLTRTLSEKVKAIQAARKAASELKKRLPYTNLNIPPYSEVTIYTESHPSGINANAGPNGIEGRPGLYNANCKLFGGSVRRRDFYYKHRQNCHCSTAQSLEEAQVWNTKRSCKMAESMIQAETVAEVEE